MAILTDTSGANSAGVDVNGALKTGIVDSNGNAALKVKGAAWAAGHGAAPLAAVNDGVYRPLRGDRFGGLAQARFTQKASFNLFTAALPPTWLNPATTMTATTALASGVLLNASAIVTASTNASLISMTAIQKYQKTPIQVRQRIRLSSKGGANAAADWGLIGSQAPASVVPVNGIVWLYGIDGTLKPTIYINSTVVSQGTDIAGSITTDRYYVWDIIVDDDFIIFIVQDPTTGLIISEQTLNINIGDARVGGTNYWFLSSRAYVGASAGTGAATQLFVSDQFAGYLDTDTYQPWSHQMASLGMGLNVNPTTALTQLENNANSAAAASATLSNTTNGYATTLLGGKFQFAAVAGAETDYCLFAFTVPAGVKLIITGVRIDLFNMGAAVATTPTLCEWFLDENSVAITLASNSYRRSIGSQSLPVGAAIGTNATPIDVSFADGPMVTHSGRFFKLGLRMPVGTATASQIIRGSAGFRGYFE